ncbi:hypothetical protein SDC9_187719 [bioreactor metagenome]|uniref:Uncharacterized protein n=1 Tax=bioreactor metagenome TaxID=1076179 RepID=A0A645HXZ4_9ZZZZ
MGGKGLGLTSKKVGVFGKIPYAQKVAAFIVKSGINQVAGTIRLGGEDAGHGGKGGIVMGKIKVPQINGDTGGGGFFPLKGGGEANLCAGNQICHGIPENRIGGFAWKHDGLVRENGGKLHLFRSSRKAKGKFGLGYNERRIPRVFIGYGSIEGGAFGTGKNIGRCAPYLGRWTSFGGSGILTFRKSRFRV